MCGFCAVWKADSACRSRFVAAASSWVMRPPHHTVDGEAAHHGVAGHRPLLRRQAFASSACRLAETRRSRIADIAQGASPVPDKTTDDLAPGFYWVRVDGLPPEVARRDAEAGEWVLIGQESGLADGGRGSERVVGAAFGVRRPGAARAAASVTAAPSAHPPSPRAPERPVALGIKRHLKKTIVTGFAALRHEI
jgi:hypothetical protein